MKRPLSNETGWAAWSRETVALLNRRNRVWIERFGLVGAPYRWDLETATLAFQRDQDTVVADLCVIGTTSASEGTFLWAWANQAIPEGARQRLEEMRDFGLRHGLGLLTSPERQGGHAEGLAMLTVAGRILDADGAWVETSGDITFFFALFDFRAVAPSRT